MVRSSARGNHRRAHRLPTGRCQHRHLQQSRFGGAVGQRPSGGHDFVHRFYCDRLCRNGRCRGHHQKVFLELGGKSAFVVLDDADLAAASAVSAFSACMHAGQGCAITTRLVVPRARYEEAVAIAAATMSSIRPGDPNDPGTVCGPLISARQRDRVQGYLDLAVAEGGRFACGGARPADREVGFYIEPTVIAGLTNDARVAREEIFGPVLTVIAHDGDDDAVRIANDSPYGLSGTVYGADPQRAAVPRGCG